MKMSKKQKIIWTIVISACLFILFSCTCTSFLFRMIFSDTDLTHLPEYNFASMAGTRWKTKTNVAIADFSGSKYLIAPQQFNKFKTADYPYASGYASRALAEFPAGTYLRIEKLTRSSPYLNEGGVTTTRVLATLEDKAHSQKKVYLDRDFFEPNAFLRRRIPSTSKTWTVNPDLLETAK